MSKLPAKKQLLNKFSAVEESLIDSETHNEILSAEAPIQSSNLPSESKKSDVEVLVNTKIVLKKSLIFVSASFVRAIASGGRMAQKQILSPAFALIKKGKASFNQKKIKAEVGINKYLDQKELSQAEKTIIQTQQKNQESEYIDEVKQYFETLFKIKGYENSILLDAQTNEIKEAIRRDGQTFELLMSKLDEKNLSANVFGVKQSLACESGKIHHKVEFSLKVNGLKWALFISKFVLPVLNEKVQNEGGSLKADYVSNVTLGYDKYVLNLTTFVEQKKEVKSEVTMPKIKQSLVELEN